MTHSKSSRFFQCRMFCGTKIFFSNIQKTKQKTTRRMCKLITISLPLLLVALSLSMTYLDVFAPMRGSFPWTNVGLKHGFSMETAPDVAGKTFLVTGCNTGIGKENVRLLALKKGTVVMACRKVQNCLEAKADIEKAVPGKDYKLIVLEDAPLDLSSLKSVDDYIKAYKKSKLPLDVLIANAGIMYFPYELTKDGLEVTMAVNHFGHALLTLGLLPVMKESKFAPRVVMVSSLGHRTTVEGGVKLSLKEMNDPNSYATLQHEYGQSKLANILFTKALQKKLDAAGIKAYVNAAHPGGVQSDLGRYLVENEAVRTMLMKIISLLLWDTERGTYTQLHCAISPDIETNDVRGKYHVPIAIELDEMGTTHFAKDEKLIEDFWKFTNQVLKEKGYGNTINFFDQ